MKNNCTFSLCLLANSNAMDAIDLAIPLSLTCVYLLSSCKHCCALRVDPCDFIQWTLAPLWRATWLGEVLGWGAPGGNNVLVFAFRKLRFCSFMYLRRRSWHYALATSCNAEDALDAMVSQRSSPLTAQVDTLQAIELQRHPGLDITPWCVPRCCEAAEQAKLPMLQRTFSTCQRTSHGCMILNYKADGIWKEIEHCVKSMSHYFQIIPLKYYMFLPLITASSISKHPLKKRTYDPTS